MVDELGKRFVVTSSSDILKANPDIIPLSDVISCNLDLQVDDTELKKEDAQGKEVSYNPPRFCYSYNFYIEISVRHPWFSQIRFRLNSSDIEIVDEVTGMGAGMGRMMGSRRQSMVHPEYNMDYRKYQQMADEIVAVLTGQPTARSVAANVINNMADGQGFVNSVVSGIGAGAGMAGAESEHDAGPGRDAESEHDAGPDRDAESEHDAGSGRNTEWKLGLLLWHDKHRKILSELWFSAAGSTASPLQQLRLGADRSDTSAEILPAVRKSILAETTAAKGGADL